MARTYRRDKRGRFASGGGRTGRTLSAYGRTGRVLMRRGNLAVMKSGSDYFVTRKTTGITPMGRRKKSGPKRHEIVGVAPSRKAALASLNLFTQLNNRSARLGRPGTVKVARRTLRRVKR